MVELGAEEEKYNYEFGRYMAGRADVALLIGRKHTASIARGLADAGFPPESVHTLDSLEEAVRFNRENLRQGDAGAEPDQSVLKNRGLFHARSFPAGAAAGYLCSHAMSQKEAS